MGPDSPELQPEVIDAEARGEIVAEARQEALSGTLSGLIDAQGLINDVQQGMSEGRSGAEAVTRAVARTYAGNAVSEGINGISDVRGTMAAAGMLPEGINNLMPDQAAANLVGTGMDGWAALGADAISSYQAGELDTTALDQFNQALRDRPGLDPFRGLADSADLLSEEYGRAAGDWGQMADNLGRDWERIEWSDLGEVTVERMTDFQQEVAAGQHNYMLQGWNNALEVAAEATQTEGSWDQFVEDTFTIGRVMLDDAETGGEMYGGMGGDFWQEIADHNNAVVRDIPVVGTIFDGYAQIGSGLEEQGVVGFSTEMYEGASALYAEGEQLAADLEQQATDAAFDAAVSTYDYLRTFW